MSTTVDVERIESLESQVHDLDAALRSARIIRFVFLCAILALMALIIYLFLGLFHKVNSEKFRSSVAQEAQTRLTENQDRYMNEVKSVVDSASPLVTQAFYQQSKADMPKYTAALERQRELFLEEVKAKLDVQLKNKYADLLAKYETRLIEEFPRLKDQAFRNKVMRSLDKAIGELASKYYTEQLGMVVGGIYEDWDRFPMAEEPGPNDPQLGDQLIGTLLELTTERLSE